MLFNAYELLFLPLTENWGQTPLIHLADLQADINSHFATRVVAPLLPIEAVPHYASALNPVFEIEGARFVMATQGMAAAPLAILKHPVSSLEHR